MARVAVLAARDRLAERVVGALRRSPLVDACERLHDGPAGGLSGVDVLVYLPPPAGRSGLAPDVTAVRAFCERAEGQPLAHVVVVSSAAIYSAHHENAGLLAETAFVPAGRSPVADRWREVERLTERLGGPSATRTILRPAAVLDGEDYFSRLLDGALAFTYPGHDPTLQLLSPDDLAEAVAAVVGARAGGVYNVAPAGGVPLRHALRLARVRRAAVPRLVQQGVRAVTAPAGLSASADDLKYIQYSWTVSGDRLRRTVGFAPSKSSAEAIADLVPGSAANHPSPVFDEFGMDTAYIRRYCRHLFRLLHRYYWRVEIEGFEHVPATGRGVLVGAHRGFMPFDGVMALYACVQRHDRFPRFLIHPSLTKFPFLADFMAKLGGIIASQENGAYVLERDELLGVFPEGIRGAFTMYKRAYRLGKFGRDEYVRMALRHRAPILPFVTVGSAEIYPILGGIRWSWFKRYTQWPFLPIVPAPFPLPSKWHTQFLPPVPVHERYPAEAADDPDVVRRVSLEVRERMQQALDALRARRRSVFFGSVFEQGERL